jgi:hypothetical protein
MRRVPFVLAVLAATLAAAPPASADPFFPEPGGTALTAPDTDGDGLSDDEELQLGTDPGRSDTDGDGVGDGIEVRTGSNPLRRDRNTRPWNMDTDGDGDLDDDEVAHGTDPFDQDSDDDGMLDSVDPSPLHPDKIGTAVDWDLDGLTNDQEGVLGLNPFDSSDAGFAREIVEQRYTGDEIGNAHLRDLAGVPATRAEQERLDAAVAAALASGDVLVAERAYRLVERLTGKDMRPPGHGEKLAEAFAAARNALLADLKSGDPAKVLGAARAARLAGLVDDATISAALDSLFAQPKPAAGAAPSASAPAITSSSGGSAPRPGSTPTPPGTAGDERGRRDTSPGGSDDSSDAGDTSAGSGSSPSGGSTESYRIEVGRDGKLVGEGSRVVTHNDDGTSTEVKTIAYADGSTETTTTSYDKDGTQTSSTTTTTNADDSTTTVCKDGDAGCDSGMRDPDAGDSTVDAGTFEQRPTRLEQLGQPVVHHALEPVVVDADGDGEPDVGVRPRDLVTDPAPEAELGLVLRDPAPAIANHAQPEYGPDGRVVVGSGEPHPPGTGPVELRP